jgi:hypothetical protein
MPAGHPGDFLPVRHGHGQGQRRISREFWASRLQVRRIRRGPVTLRLQHPVDEAEGRKTCQSGSAGQYGRSEGWQLR